MNYSPVINWFKRYASRRMLVVFMLGFSSGLPLALVTGTLQAWFKTSGASVVMIGWMTLVGQPYSYKYFWAPVLDKFAPTANIDRRRGWMLLAQLAIVGVIVAMAFSDPHATISGIPYIENMPVLLVLAFLLSFCSATQDIAIDAYRAEMLASDERGLGTALAVEGYRIAMIASGGFALFLADRFGWQHTYLCMAALMGIGLIATIFAPAVKQDEEVKNHNLLELVLNSFKEFLTRKKALWFLLFIVIYKLSDAFAHALSTTFLLDMQYSLTEVGTINKVFGMFATLIGVLLGGIFMTKAGMFKALFTFGLLSAVTNLFYMLLAIVGKNVTLACAGVFVENLCGGMGTASLVALMMSLCNSKYTATQFALLSSLAAMGRIYVGPVSGHLVESFGWAHFYMFTAIVAAPSLILLAYLRPEINQREIKVEDDVVKVHEEPQNDAVPAANH